MHHPAILLISLDKRLTANYIENRNGKQVMATSFVCAITIWQFRAKQVWAKLNNNVHTVLLSDFVLHIWG